MCGFLFASVLTAWVPARWPESIIEVGSFSLALFWVVRLALRGEPIRTSPLLVPPLMFLLWGSLQLAFGWTMAESQTLRGVIHWGAILSLVFAGLQTFDLETRERFLRIFFAFGFVLSMVATLQSFTSGGKVFWLYSVPDPLYMMGPFLYHNEFAAFVELLLPLALVPAIQYPDKRIRYFLMAAALVASVIVSASRSGFVLCVAETFAVIAVCSWRERQGFRRAAAAMLALTAVTALLAGIVGWDTLAGRYQLKDNGRMEMFRSSTEMIRDHGWLGVGLGNWPTAYPFYAHYDDGMVANQAHNDWAQWTAEGGVVMLAGALFLLAWTLRQCLVQVWCLGPAFVMLQGVFDYPFQKPHLAALVFVVLAAGAAARDGVVRTKRNLTS